MCVGLAACLLEAGCVVGSCAVSLFRTDTLCPEPFATCSPRGITDSLFKTDGTVVLLLYPLDWGALGLLGGSVVTSAS